MAERELPRSLDAEAALIGAVLFDNEIYARFEFLKPEDFYDPVHGEMYRWIGERISAGQLADGVTAAQLAPDLLKGLGGVEYLADLLDKAATGPAATQYAGLIQDYALRRDIIRVSDEMAARAQDLESEGDARGQISEAEAELFALSRQREGGAGAISIGRAAREALRDAEAVKGGKIPEGTVFVGLRELDRALNGLQPEQLVILAGRPGMGKSAMALRLAFGAAQRGSVLDFSLEMSARQNGVRALAAYANGGPAYSDIAGGRYDDSMALETAAERVARMPIYFEETPGLTPPQILLRARRFARRMAETQTPLRLVIVDHLGRVGGSRPGMKPYERVSEAVEALKNVAKELGVPVLAGCQLSRELRNRANKRPLLDDLRESGRVEEEADVVMGLYRDSYYAELEGVPDDESDQAEWAGRVADRSIEVLILKNRQGDTARVKLFADMSRNVIQEFDSRENAA